MSFESEGERENVKSMNSSSVQLPHLHRVQPWVSLFTWLGRCLRETKWGTSVYKMNSNIYTRRQLYLREAASPIIQHCQNMSWVIFNLHTECYSIVPCPIMCCHVLCVYVCVCVCVCVWGGASLKGTNKQASIMPVSNSCENMYQVTRKYYQADMGGWQ